MSIFALYYKCIRTSHSKFYCQIEADNAAIAFKKAVSVMYDKGMDPDTFSVFYVAPIYVDHSISYDKQRHGWNEHAQFPQN